MRQTKQWLATATMLLCSITRISGEIILTQSDGLLNTATANSAGVLQYVYTSPVLTLNEATNTLVFTFLEGYTTTQSLNDTNGYPFVALAEFYLYDGNGNEIALDQSNFSTNAQEPTEGWISNICDKNLSTFFHSMWSTGASDYHNIIITLPEGLSLKDFKFKYVTRYTQQCVPKKISIKTGNDLLAEGACGDDLTWELTYGGNLSISGNGPMDDYVYFKEDAPWNEYLSQIKKVTINDGVTSIGNNAFYWYYNLSTVILPESIERIGTDAFRGTELTSIYIPKNVENIAETAFVGCNFTSIVVDENNTVYDSRNNSNAIIETATNKLICGCGATIIPDDVEEIGAYAFNDCDELVSITIPKKVSQISSGSFAYCSNLTSIVVDAENTVYDSRNNSNAIIETSTNTIVRGTGNTVIPESVKAIGDEAFSECETLTSLTLPEGVSSIGHSAFYYCYNLASINLPQGITSIEDWTFFYCSSLPPITIPEGVTSIGSYAFEGCSKLTAIAIPQNVTSIGREAFASCSALTSVTFSGKVTEIKDFTFALCTKLSSISLPNNLESIGNYAFWGCEKIKKLTMPENTESIGNYAFQYCSALQSITLPNSVKHVGEHAFQFCQGLTSLTISESLDTISNYAFSKCAKLREVTIPHSVSHIGEGAFWDCAYLRTVTIGKNVKTIDDGAFAANPVLTEINSYATTPPQVLGDYVFVNVDKGNCTLNIPIGSKSMYTAADAWWEFGVIVESEELSYIEQLNATNASAWPANIYDMNGRLVREGAYTTNGLANGMYLINGKKIIIE